MTDSTDATTADEEAQHRLCPYCKKTGVDCCIGFNASVSGPDREVFAHGACAATDERVRVLYRLIPPTDTCAVCREPGATVSAPLFLGSVSPRYVHPGCASAEASASGGAQ